MQDLHGRINIAAGHWLPPGHSSKQALRRSGLTDSALVGAATNSVFASLNACSEGDFALRRCCPCHTLSRRSQLIGRASVLATAAGLFVCRVIITVSHV
jgi:hypothetical protein